MRALKPMPEGRNWQYSLGDLHTLLRNVGSVDPANDGWLVTHDDPRLVSSHVHIEPSVALLLLRGLRAQQLRERDPLNQPCAEIAWWVDFRGNEHEVKCGASRAGESQLCGPCYAKAERNYPQGWRSYPGDTCRHGVYVGGCGVDWMCGRCENGEDEDLPAYA